jgi:methionyl-tRNA formyltransferase/UDP-4-amino-4-deoxy-L-arabinose formyltransferase/UDP-glucuronic acid dehydrogenase (UDP-4-keto-hexauronic acid decarboxylating)
MNSKALSIAFLTGTDKSFLLKSLVENGLSVRVVILPATSQREDRLIPVTTLAAKLGIPTLRPRRSDLAATLRRVDCDTLLSAGYPFLLDAEQLAVCRHNLNVHPALLPRYRGAATGWHVLAYGEKESGVTVHFIDSGMDTGPILAQIRIPLSPFDTLLSQTRKINGLEPEAVQRALVRVCEGDTGDQQSEACATTFTERRTPEDSKIDPDSSLRDLYNFIRACDPERFPAYFDVEGQKVGIRLFRLERPAGEEDMI